MKEWLLPPADASTDQLMRWRMVIAGSALAQWVATAALAAALMGNIPGIDSYVTAAQLSTLEQLVRNTREDQLISQILDYTRRYCLSYEANDAVGMQTAFQNLQDVRTKYYQLTGREYPQLMCTMSAQPGKQ